MNDEYQGLNLPQLLDLMHPLVESEAAVWTPQTVGWLVAGLWLVAVMLLVARKVYRAWRRNRYRRAALAELNGIESAGSLAVLLRRTALAAYPRTEVASLFGAEWADFLRRSCPGDRVVDESADALAIVAYRRDADVDALIRPARHWIRGHRV